VHGVVIALLAAGAGFSLRGMDKGPYAQGVEQATFTELCGYIDDNVNRESLIVTWNPRVLALYTGRRTAWYPEDASDASLDAYFARMRAQYVLVYAGSSQDTAVLSPHVRRTAGFSQVFQNSDFTLYRIL
jgi:hypothetical protein